MKDTNEKPTSGDENGAASLVSELKKIFTIYAKDLKTLREGGAEVELLSNQDLFDMVVKLLNVSDKITKLYVVEQSDGEDKTSTPKIRNIQDFTLNKGK